MGMTEDEQKALRALLREEINAAIYASEQRLGGQINRFEDRLSALEVGQQRVQVDLMQVIVVLNEATKVISQAPPHSMRRLVKRIGLPPRNQQG